MMTGVYKKEIVHGRAFLSRRPVQIPSYDRHLFPLFSIDFLIDIEIEGRKGEERT